MSEDHKEGTECTAKRSSLERVREALPALDAAMAREGGFSLAGFFSFVMPCGVHPTAMTLCCIDAIPEDLTPESVSALRAQVAEFIKRIATQYPKD